MSPLNNDPVIVGFNRSAIGRFGGALKLTRPDDLLAHLIKSLVKKNHLDPKKIGEVIIGCANQAGEDNRNIARMSSMLAGLPLTTPALTVNRLCASGMDAIIAGARRIICGEHELVLVGGVESMSRAPLVMEKNFFPNKPGAPKIFDSALGWRFFNENMREITPPESNGMTAENLLQQYKISRERQDQFAFMSHKRALNAQEKNYFAKEIESIEVKVSAKESTSFAKDEQVRIDCTLENLSKLKPAFKPGGTVTAGNSSSLNDGAAVLALCSKKFAENNSLNILARIIDYDSAGVDPRVMGIGPVFSTRKILQRRKWNMKDFDAIEINEAFAAQVLAVCDELGVSEERVNKMGGAIALGHPLGCSGARIVLTLVNQMQEQNLELGLATLCVGVGQGVSLALQKV